MYTYQLHDALYINLTNQCTNNCVFCIRKKPEAMGVNLWLDKEPSGEDVIYEIPDPNRYKEIVFCGYGEPTLRLPQLLQISKYLKEHGGKIRLNTNGHGSLIWGRNIVPELAEYIEAVSISLNAKDKNQYNHLCQPENETLCYDAVIDFAKECKKYIPEVSLSVVDLISAYDIEICKEISKNLGTTFKVRHTIK
ncbi:MAG: Radical domain protein [Clostridia bacterium]|nr:Radical domain protein [Clostridia bacterium]